MEDIDLPQAVQTVDPAPADEESADVMLNQLLEVMSALQSNPYDYAMHERNIQLCQKLGVDMIGEFNQAKTMMAEYYPMKESFFIDWISHLKSCQSSEYSVEAVQEVLDIYEQASSYSFSPSIEKARLNLIIDLFYYARSLARPAEDLMDLIEEFTPDVSMEIERPSIEEQRNPEQLELENFITPEKIQTLAFDVIDKMGYHLVDSSAIWGAWAVYEFDNLKRSWTPESLSRFKTMLQNRLRVPHLESAKTFQAYSTLITKHENDRYEEEMVEANNIYSVARKAMEDREIHESQLVKSGHSSEEYLKYLSWEISRKTPNFDLTYTLFERALLDQSNSTEIWMEFLRFVGHRRDQPGLPISVSRRAIRTVPWCGDVWASAIRTFERGCQPIEAVEALCSKAIDSKFLEHDSEALIAFTVGRADFHRRRLEAYASAGGEDSDQLKALMSSVTGALQHGISAIKKLFPKSGDPACRLEKYLTALYEHHDQEDETAKVWQKATKQYRGVYSVWLSAADCEVRRGDLVRARDYYKKASNIKLDYPEYLLQAWLTFEHHFGSLDDIEYAISKVNNLMKGINARRKREAEQELPVAQDVSSSLVQTHQGSAADAPLENHASNDSSESRKRKVDQAADGNTSAPANDKKVKLSEPPSAKILPEKDGDVSELKRDRENSTVLVGGLKPGVTEVQISQLFRDCGKIREIVIHRIDSADLVATVEFLDRNSVLPAQTKDKKQLDQQEISVSLAWRSTLYVTNFPESATDDWIREKFGRYGKIFDVRWPSKRYKSTRRFCYVQFTTTQSAESALELHNLEVAPQQKMSVLISDPMRKQTRTDVRANDRELYITCLSKFVQEPDLRKLFSQFGSIKGVRMMLDEAGHSKGFAFVEFEDEASAKAALNMNNVELKKRRIGVTISSGKGLSLARKQPTEFKAESKMSSVTDQRARSVKVQNLPEGAQEALVQQALERFGKVRKTLTYPEKNEALVEFDSATDAGKALLHPDPIIINGQSVELSALGGSLKLDAGTYDSYSPLLPRTALKGKRAQKLGLGASARGVTGATSKAHKQDPAKQDVTMKDNLPSHATSNGGKSQDDFRKMLG